jgi:hypothetical protein
MGNNADDGREWTAIESTRAKAESTWGHARGHRDVAASDPHDDTSRNYARKRRDQSTPAVQRRKESKSMTNRKRAPSKEMIPPISCIETGAHME